MLTPAKRIANFEKMGFGMFIHWGLYSQLGKGEWIKDCENIPMDEYKKLMNTFTAEDFDAEKIVLAAKNAGCKYITLTTRHHEGFSLYDTKGLSDFDAPKSPAKRDLIKEFVDACNKHGIKPFFYHTTLDWYNPDFYNDFDTYLEYLRKSVEILCTNYGEIGGLWFDGNWSKPADTDWKLDDLYGTIRKHQPEAMIINNTGLGARGELGHPEIDSVTFEQGRPTPMDRSGMKKYITAEMCYTLNNHWGIGANDFDYKAPSELIKALCDCRKVGANYLLNIGPTAQGAIQPIQEEYLKIMGRWMDLFGEAVYEGKPYYTNDKNEDFALKADDGTIYLFVYNLKIKGSENVVTDTTNGLEREFICDKKVQSIEWMDNGEQLSFTQDGNKLSVSCTGFNYGSHYCVRVARVK